MRLTSRNVFRTVALGLILQRAPLAAQSLVASPGQLTFTSVADSATPFAPQTLQVTSTGASVPFAFYTNDPDLNRYVTASSATTPAIVTFAPPVGKALFGTTKIAIVFYVPVPGSQITPSAESDATLTFTAPPPPTVTAIVDAATFQAGPLSPGEMIAIFGENIGPLFDMTTLLRLGPAVLFPPVSGATQVEFYTSANHVVDAPILYAAKGQVNAIVPVEVAGQSNVKIVLTHYEAPAPALTLPLTDTTPAIFSASGQGSGQGAILNANSSPNSAANPAPKGSIVQIFAEGAGLRTPAGLADGMLDIGSISQPTPVAPVSITIGGQPAQILYAAQAPNLVLGVLQVNAVVPQNIGSGAQPVVLTVGSNNNRSQGITVAVQ
jgi:hypothetical protein